MSDSIHIFTSIIFIVSLPKISTTLTAISLKVQIGGDDARNFEPKGRLKFEDLDKSIRELRAMFKQHPQWFEVPKPKSDKGQNAVDYSI